MSKIKMMEKKYTRTIIILSIIVVCLSGFIIFDKFIFNNNVEVKDENIKDENDANKDSSDVQSLSDRFAFKDGSIIYSADYNDFLENGVKDIIIEDADRLANMVMFNYNLYYIDNTGKLVVYNPYKKSSIEYTFEGVKIHANTVILPGKDYTIISDCSTFVRIDMKENKYKKLDITSRNYKMVYEDDSKLLYYINGNDVVEYDIVNEKIVKTIANNMGPELIADNELYLFNFLNNNVLGVYNKSTGEINSLDFNNNNNFQVYSLSVVDKINGSLYLISGDHTLFKYSNNNVSTILDGGFLSSIVAGNNIFIKDYQDSCSGCPTTDNNKFYMYSILDGKLTDVNYAYIKNLFEFRNVFYY